MPIYHVAVVTTVEIETEAEAEAVKKAYALAQPSGLQDYTYILKKWNASFLSVEHEAPEEVTQRSCPAGTDLINEKTYEDVHEWDKEDEQRSQP